MSTQGQTLPPGHAMKVAYKRTEKKRARQSTDDARLARARAVWLRREATRAAQHQALLRAAFYERHPELAA